MFEDLLHRVRRPVQYVDGEVNAVHKPAFPGEIVVALAFPDTYELGMSHLGLKILAAILNRVPDVRCERVFHPEDDLAALLRQEKEPLSTLESRTPLGACHLVGFTLQSELHATGILEMLDLAGIPLLAAERGGDAPLVVGGGPQAMNPEPLADFFDLFVLGDGEEVVVEMVEALRAGRLAGDDRRTLLGRMAKIEGVYVPSGYSVDYLADGAVSRVVPAGPGFPAKVNRRVVADLDLSPIPDHPPVPYLETTHDRVTVEVARGCMRGCRFCHAGMVYRPYRERSPRTVLEGVLRSLDATGYDEVSLASLSSGDYCHLVPLVRSLAAELKPRWVSLSLPSIRPGSLPDDVIEAVGAVRKSGFTMAPEAGTERLRRVINKGINEEEILATARSIFSHGWKSIKLYFMVGLPTETEEDVRGIADLALRIRRLGQECGIRQPGVTVSISPFVPKAHTPLQWAPMASMADLEGAVALLQKLCRQRGVVVKWHNPSMSLVEGVLARGDRRLGKALLGVWRRGGRLEAWGDRFRLERWTEALAEAGLESFFYTGRERAEDELLPWDHLDSRVDRGYLWREYRRGLEAEVTPPCDIGSCRACGACAGEEPAARDLIEIETGEPSAAVISLPGEQRFRMRLRFRKVGTLRWVSHLELFRAFHRACRRAGVPLAHSAGFNPHPRISFAPPLSMGAEGEAELVDLELSAAFSTDRLLTALNAVLPPGLEITAARFLPTGAPALFESVSAVRLRFLLPAELGLSAEEVAARCRELLTRESIPLRRESGGKDRLKEVRPFLLALDPAEAGEGRCVLDAWVGYTSDGSIRPAELLGLLFPDRYPWVAETPLTRRGLYRREGERFLDLFANPAPPPVRPAPAAPTARRSPPPRR